MDSLFTSHESHPTLFDAENGKGTFHSSSHNHQSRPQRRGRSFKMSFRKASICTTRKPKVLYKACIHSRMVSLCLVTSNNPYWWQNSQTRQKRSARSNSPMSFVWLFPHLEQIIFRITFIFFPVSSRSPAGQILLSAYTLILLESPVEVNHKKVRMKASRSCRMKASKVTSLLTSNSVISRKVSTKAAFWGSWLSQNTAS